MLLRRFAAGVVAAGAVVALAGCGGGSDPLTLPTRDTDASVPAAETTAAPADTGAGTTPGAVTTTVPAAAVPTTIAAGSTWEPAASNLEGTPSECGNLSLVAADPDRDVVVAGVALNGLFASADGSPTWAALGTAGGATIQNRAASIIFDPADDQTFWESGHYAGGGVFRTTDGGATFEQLGDITHVDTLGIDFSDPARSTMLVGKHEQPILLRSTDGGETWAEVQGLPDGIGYAAFPLVLDADTYLLGTNSGASSGIFRSADAGATWTKVFDQPVNGAPLLTSDGRILWIPGAGGSLIESTDQGATWTETDAPVRGTWTGVVEVAGGRLVALSDSNVMVSDDGGVAWQPVGPALPYTPWGFAYAPFRDAVYVWQFECGDGDMAVDAGAIMRLDVDLG